MSRARVVAVVTVAFWVALYAECVIVSYLSAFWWDRYEPKFGRSVSFQLGVVLGLGWSTAVAVLICVCVTLITSSGLPRNTSFLRLVLYGIIVTIPFLAWMLWQTLITPRVSY